MHQKGQYIETKLRGRGLADAQRIPVLSASAQGVSDDMSTKVPRALSQNA